MTRLGLIAGNGNFPFLVLDAARAQGHEVVVAAIKEEASLEIESRGAASVHWLSLGELSKLIDTFKAEGENVISKIKALIHEGNVRRVVIQHQGRTVAEFPLTAGVVGAVLAPVLAAIGAVVALLQDCTIQVERAKTEETREEPSQTAAR